jgi:hypothetical protein
MKIKYKIKQLCFTDARRRSLLKQNWRDVLWRIAFLSITMSYEGLRFFQLQCPMKDCISFKYNMRPKREK